MSPTAKPRRSAQTFCPRVTVSKRPDRDYDRRMNRRRQPLLGVMGMAIALLVGGLAVLTGSCPAYASITPTPATAMHMNGPCRDETSPPSVSACLLICQAVLPEPPKIPFMGISEKLPPFADRAQLLNGTAIEPQTPPPR